MEFTEFVRKLLDIGDEFRIERSDFGNLSKRNNRC
jgi:hypothetical protein